ATHHADAAVASARAANRLRPDPASAIALGQALAAVGDAAGAIAAMRAALSSGPLVQPGERVGLLAAVADVEIASGARGDAARTLDELEHAVIDTEGMVALHQRRARLDERLSNPNQARWEQEQAQQLRHGEAW